MSEVRDAREDLRQGLLALAADARWSAAQAAQYCGVSRARWYELRRGRMSLEAMRAIVRHLAHNLY